MQIQEFEEIAISSFHELELVCSNCMCTSQIAQSGLRIDRGAVICDSHRVAFDENNIPYCVDCEETPDIVEDMDMALSEEDHRRSLMLYASCAKLQSTVCSKA